MTGREYIQYILANRLEDEEIFKDGKIIGFISISEAAEKFNVGVETVFTWISLGRLDHIDIGGNIYIPTNAEVYTH